MAAIVGNGYTMHVSQFGIWQENFADVYNSGEAFSVVWWYTPNDYERAAGAMNRQVITQNFKARTGFINVVGGMRALREKKLLERDFINTPELAAFMGI